ncbi:RNase III domain protein [Sporothrix brasiliensis 5110]|uniref:RNase III domain protein n=1 Tax=Sporothrix brasiliensis 5110 TaxID=1398154 RepID=A0A0C2J078_9PEZI|nr:RNase III domain protein [Sporothrix brasiliensis 5110]KIH92400.1 RNase III domain protein [Sporothrix brasiliensis 5110]
MRSTHVLNKKGAAEQHEHLAGRIQARKSATQDPIPRQTQTTTDESSPRWAHTPARMKAPFSIQQPKDPRRSVWVVNEDPARLDRMYEKLLGPQLARNLPDELKWLAVTHKSFDNGRRGFNTRLAFFGRMILASETTRAIMSRPAAAAAGVADAGQADAALADPYGREPFSHPALDNVDKLSTAQPHDYATPAKLTMLARDVGLPGVVRWKPRMPDNLEGSGITTVMTSTLYAIIGVVALHHGAAAANRIVQERIINYLAQ